MLNKLQETLGFYYMVFQSQLNGYVKCWIDGNENWNYYSVDKVLGFTEAAGQNYSLYQTMKSCLNETGLFIWIIEANKISRLRPDESVSNIGQQLSINNFVPEHKQTKSIDPTSVNFDWKRKIRINGQDLE